MRRSPLLITLVALLALGGLYLVTRVGTREGDGRGGDGVRPEVALGSPGGSTPALVAAARSPQESSSGSGTGSGTQRAPVLLEADTSATSTDGAAPRGELLVVEADGHTPRPGFAVRFVLCDANAAASEPERLVRWGSAFETDAEGRAEVSASLARAPEAEFVRFFSSRDERFELLPSELRIAELSADVSAPTILRLLPRETAPVRALAVDASSREPLQNFALRVQRLVDMPDAERPVSSVGTIGYFVATRFWDATDCEWVITDTTGYFTTERAYPSGRLGFLTIDQERADLQHDGRAGAQPSLLEVPVGPRVRLAFTPCGSRSAMEYVAGIWRAPEELVATEGVREFPSPWSADRTRRAGFWGNAVPVQVERQSDGQLGGDTFVRLAVDQGAEPLPSFLFLLSRDGASFGYAALETFERYRDVPLVVELEERLALAAVLVWPEGAGGGADLDVRLQSLEHPEGSTREVAVDRIRGEDRTAFQFQAVAPGDYRMRINSTGFEALELDVSLPRYDTVEIRPRLASPQETHELAFRIVTDSGLPLDGEADRARLAGVYLWPVDAPGGRIITGTAVWRDGVGSVLLEGVRAGSYRPEARWIRGVHAVESSGPQIQVPGPDQELRVHDALPAVRAEVRIQNPPSAGALVVSAAQTGSGRLNEQFRFTPEHPRERSADGSEALTFRTGPIDAGLELRARLESEEHRLVMLEDGAFAAPDGEGVRRLVIDSSPGFTARIRVWALAQPDGEARVPVPELVLTLDGIEQAPTNSTGTLTLSLDETPERIGISTPGWKLVTRTSWDDWGSVFADTGKFTVEGGYLDVFLEPTAE